MKKIFIFIALAMFSFTCFAKDHTITLEITNVRTENGRIYIALYNDEKSYSSERPIQQYIIPATVEKTVYQIEVPQGEYLISLFQDVNNNETIDFNIFKVPKEPFGLSNYDAKSIPGKFKKHKFTVEDDITVSIPLIRF